jgi:hypothetical protein
LALSESEKEGNDPSAFRTTCVNAPSGSPRLSNLLWIFAKCWGIRGGTRNLSDIYLAAQQEYAAHGLPNGGPAIWIVKTDGAFDPVSNTPTDNGIQQEHLAR